MRDNSSALMALCVSLASFALLIAACSGSESSSSGSAGASSSSAGSAGGAGTGDGGGGSAGSSMTGSGSAGGSMAGGGGAGGQAADCHGDAAVWAQIKKGGIACAKNSDCCSLLLDCPNCEYTTVHASDFAAAQAAYPYCDSQCPPDCIAPPITPECNNGMCELKDDPAGQSGSFCGAP